jgi:hypothetical protein
MVKKIKGTECKGRWCETHLFSMEARLVMNDTSIEETLRLCPKFNKLFISNEGRRKLWKEPSPSSIWITKATPLSSSLMKIRYL